MPSENPKPQTIAEALMLIKVSRWARVDDLASWAGVDDGTVYDWLRGNQTPRWDSICLIVRHCRDPRIRDAINAALNYGTEPNPNVFLKDAG